MQPAAPKHARQPTMRLERLRQARPSQLHVLVAALLASSAAGTGLWIWTSLLRAWLPNIVTTMAAVAMTITVVDHVVRREEKRREQGRSTALPAGSLNASP